MKLKHTCGIWSIEPHGDNYALYCSRDGYHHGYNLMSLSDGDMNFENNCRLIEAAPDMLKALITFVGEQNPKHYTQFIECEVIPAIEKATGMSIEEVLGEE